MDVVGLVVLLLLPMATSAAAQQTVPGPRPSGLGVTVRMTGGGAILDASVTVADSTGRRVAQGTTNADGIARFGDLPAGTYTVTVEAAGFAMARAEATVGFSQFATLAVLMNPNAAAPAPTGRVPRPPGETTPPAEPAPELPILKSGVPPPPLGQPAEVEPAVLAPSDKVYLPLPDRWNISFPDWDRYGDRGDVPYVAGHWWDPYNQNRAKGDFPVIGSGTFFVFTGVSDTLIEGRNVPTGTTPSTERPGSEAFFGQGDQYLPVAVVRLSADLFRGDTAFRPIDWRVRVQPAISVNYIDTRETGVTRRDVREGVARLDSHVGLQELFVEKKLADLSSNYDFLSVRVGIQELSTDFRGFVAVVEQPGVRFFGTLRSSRIEYNVAAFDFLEKDTNSGFNEWHRRRQQMAVGNVYIQDFLTPGYTTEFSVHYNRDEGEPHYDHNGFLVRPAPIGLITPHEVRAYYLGWAGNGHIGRMNVSHAFYQALGTDEFNPISAREVQINAQMAAAELSIDKDWLRLKGTVFWASGDSDINDDRARGFDSILDVPVFAGGPFSVWNREGFGLAQTGTGLVSPLSLLPSLRTNKDEGQANFVNPGIFIVSGGVDMELTPKLRAFTTVSGLRFHHAEPLEALLFQSPVGENIGLDFGGGAQYRPPLTENMVIAGGVAAMRFAQGLRDLYTRRYVVLLFANVRLQF